MIHGIATITLHAGRREDLLREYRQIDPAVRAEKGCREFGPTVDVDTSIPAQGGARSNVVTIVEHLATLAATFHNTTGW